MFKSISAFEAKKIIEEKKNDKNFQLIDVRTPEEFSMNALPGAKNIDIYSPDFMQKIGALDKEASYLVYCRSGSRSMSAMEIMEQLGFQEVYDLSGGIMNF